MKKINIMTVFGTRPEAIKMAPIIKELTRHSDKIRSIVVFTGQHRKMLDQVIESINIQADFDLNIMTKTQKLSDVLCRVVTRLD